ncbi:YT521-B-like splicing protein [Mycena indigotica]|uniref:YT521-B-like splicing protein n=1 Tax=Mycena indigotica TaxID=2126181 RepID=A0A8H6TII8_9AGAR|nr:YT521-B-like splicing protein [Mycena indigotica]KAF7316360.1 YT521-B-like splicing protein [Mycena indigotica]
MVPLPIIPPQVDNQGREAEGSRGDVQPGPSTVPQTTQHQQQHTIPQDGQPYLIYPPQMAYYQPQYQHYMSPGYPQRRPLSPTYRPMPYPLFTNQSFPQFPPPSPPSNQHQPYPMSPLSPFLHTPIHSASPSASSYHGSPLPLSLSTPSSSSMASLSAPSSPQPRDRPLVRRSYHPSPPADRSEWVMWVGNVPSDATSDELQAFFTRPPPTEQPSPGGSNPWEASRAGVLSIFPISRSNCAFVNYRSPEQLQTAIGRFNGVPLRLDGRTPPLLCRVRAKDDDLRAESKLGGGKGKGQKPEDSPPKRTANTAPPSAFPHRPSTLSRPDSNVSTSSGASTSSSLLEEYFPERFFILKSLTQEDLDLSVQRKVWATQRHNEGVFDRAFRTSKNVYFIFSVNKSGEFYGYARMSGPLGTVDPTNPVKWASRDTDQTPPKRPNPSPTGSPETMLSSGHLVRNSPLPEDRQITPQREEEPEEGSESQAHAHTAPAMLPGGHGLSVGHIEMKYSLDQPRPPFPSPTPSPSVTLDASSSPKRPPFPQVARSISGAGSRIYGSGVRRSEEALVRTGIRAVGIAADGRPSDITASEPAASPVSLSADKTKSANAPTTWGQEFPLQWICTTRLPFERTKHLRNPWNSGREVKISRDGTEVEPEVGKALLAAWDALPE